MLLLTKEKSLSVRAILNGEVLDISHPRGKAEALEKIFNVLVHVQHQQKLVLMRELSAVLGVNGTCGVNRGRKMMNWDEVMEMRGQEISFGAHTINHPTLSKMELQEAKREISGSKEEIEKRLGFQQCHFAIPNGKKEDFNEELKKYCKEIGFKTIVSTEPGVVSAQSDPFFLRRIDLPHPIHIFAVTLARNIFFHRTT